MWSCHCISSTSSEHLLAFIWVLRKVGRRQNTPENATHPKTQILGTVRHLRFRVCCVFGCVLAPVSGEQRAPENATHPKTQILGTVRYLRFRVCCVFGCSLFSSEKGPPFHGSRSSREIEVQNESCQKGRREVTRITKLFSPYSIQKRPEPQICPKFVPAIVFGGPSQGVKNLQKIVKI